MKKSLIEKVGNTPVVRLQGIEQAYQLNCRLFAKLEKENPIGSVKDRPVVEILKAYQAEGKLHKGSTIIEATSGNTGISLAAFGQSLGYHVIILMPMTASIQRRELIQHYGAELILVEGTIKDCTLKAIELKNSIAGAVILGQFDHPANVLAHYRHTGPEIATQVPTVDYIVGGFGTGGTITGLAKFFNEHKPTVKIIGVEPLQSPLITQGVAGKHKIQGIGANFIPSILDQTIIDDFIDVDGDQAIAMAKQVLAVENLFIGISSGAAILGAINYLKAKQITNQDVVVILPDGGERYSWN